MKPVKLTFGGLVALFAIGMAFGQSGDFQTSGKVVNASGQAIADATITYENVAKRLSFDFSRADGTFGSPTSAIRPIGQNTNRITFPEAGPVSIDVFNMSGKKISSLSYENLDKGTYSMDAALTKLAKAMYMVKITAGNSVTYQKFLNTGACVRAAADNSSLASSPEFGLTKTLATVDTVRVGKTGYAPVKVPISTYGDNVGTVTLAVIDIESKVNAMFAALTQEGSVPNQCAMPVNSAINSGSAASNKIGSVFGGGGAFVGYTPSSCADWCDQMQNSMHGTTNKVPLMISYDGVHGMDVMLGGTILPHNMGLGAIQDSTIVEKAFRVAGLEIRGTGANWTFGPCIACVRDDRWGRMYEGFAETPELTSKMIRWALHGEQTTDLSHPWVIASTVKHFAGDGGTINGVNPGQTSGTDAEARALHLPGYTSAIQNGAACIMPSFSQWTNGTHMHCYSALLTDWLKTQQGFTGFVVGDWEAHSACAQNGDNGVSESMAAGLDVPMSPSGGTVVALIPNNARTQDACKRVLRVKYKMNLFNQYITDRSITSQVGSALHRDAVRAAVRASLVLLKNANTALPIPKTANVAVWGTGADNIGIQCGGWTASGGDAWQGSTNAHTLAGTTILQGVQSLCTGTVTSSADGSNSGNATYVIAVLSENPYAEKSFPNISLTQDMGSSTNQSVMNSIATAHAAGKKVIGVLMAGRPLDISPFINNVDAFVWASLPGTEGLGVAQVFFNDQGYHFEGKLPVSFPSSGTNYEPATGGARYTAGTGINPY